MNTVSKQTYFARTPNIEMPRSKFDLSHGHKTTFGDGGLLYPIMMADVLPGDSWECRLTSLVRLTTPIVPFMDNCRASYFAFAVPKRLLWDNFEDYITGSHKGKLGTTHTTKPQLHVDTAHWVSDGLLDHFGLPKPNSTGYDIDALPLRAYHLIWSEWFRDENIDEPLDLDLGDTASWTDSKGVDLSSLRRRRKRKDYFTGALPFVQKGPDVRLPLGDSAPVYGTGAPIHFGDPSQFLTNGGYDAYYPNPSNNTSNIAVNFRGMKPIVEQGQSPLVNFASKGVLAQGGHEAYLEADLSDATAATINSLREAFAVQHLFERDARSGTRYVESLLSHFGVQSPDFRLQRPEWIGGGSVDFIVNSVAQTSASSEQSPQGNLAAQAQSSGSVHFGYSAVEHCVLIVLACFTTDLTYQQGVNRAWLKKSRMDEYWPEFAHLGEQPVYTRELYANLSSDHADDVFGYQERFAEYRYHPSEITGKLRSDDPQSLDYWHLAQFFGTQPTLSTAFLEERPPFERVVAVQDEPKFVADYWFDCKAIRPLPIYSVPSLIDHF